ILEWILQSSTHISKDCEITFEMNPEDGSLPYLKQIKKLGINRVSIGVQSLDDSLLEVLDRRHGAEKALQAIDNVFTAGIDNISIDLMYDLPHQTLTAWQNTLHKIQTLPISHLSLYNLTIEPHTLFFKKQKQLTPHLPTQELSLQMLEYACTYLESIDLMRYEISAFAKNGRYSKHNTGYWTGRSFLGYGPSAFSFWEKKRFRNIANLNKYHDLLKSGESPVDFEEKLSYPNDLNELLAVNLRLIEGVNLEEFQKKWGQLSSLTMKVLQSLQDKKWVQFENKNVKLTKTGLLFYDSVAEEII
ncbi:MAG: radical SAM protein, partial [Chlamydiae bacterium]|nr:radical SAM protein [Chlamydiota bacterium]